MLFASAVNAVLERPRVLVVDDEASFAETMAELLAEDGYAASPVSDPAEALTRAVGGEYDAALVDLVMPGMSGLELTDRLHEVSPYTQVAIVTGTANMEAAVSLLRGRTCDYLPKKDITPVSLQGLMRGAVERARTARGQAEAHERVCESNRLLGAMRHLGAQGLRSCDPFDLLPQVVRTAKELAGATTGRVVLFTRTHGEEGLLVAASVGEGAGAIRGARLRLGEGLAAITAATGASFLLQRPDDHPRYSHKTDEMPSSLPGFLCVPVRNESVEGALLLGGWRQKPFSGKTLDSLQQLGQQAAVHLLLLRLLESLNGAVEHAPLPAGRSVLRPGDLLSAPRLI